MSYLNQLFSFWGGEGDQWFERNRAKPTNDEVLEPILQLKLPKKPTIVEVGCADGRYIGQLQKAFQARAIGIDPSAEAVEAARINWPAVEFVRSSAAAIDLFPADLIIFGFCLYLVDREYLFRIVSRTDKALKEGSYLAIHDFNPAIPKVVPYHHKDGLFSYKMNYADLWLANPQYELVSSVYITEETSMTVIRKGTWDRWK